MIRPAAEPDTACLTRLTPDDIEAMLGRQSYPVEMREIIRRELLLPPGLLSRFQAQYPERSSLLDESLVIFEGRKTYEGLEGFRRVVAMLEAKGIRLSNLTERELFIEVYRFKATTHILNAIEWNMYQTDSMYQLDFPQPGMMPPAVVAKYSAAGNAAERTRIADAYKQDTAPHDGCELLNKPWIERDDGGIDVLEGSQHKYPPVAQGSRRFSRPRASAQCSPRARKFGSLMGGRSCWSKRCGPMWRWCGRIGAIGMET